MTGAMVFLLALVDSIRGPLAPSGRAAVTMPAAEPVSGRVFDEADAMRADGERATGLCTVGSGRVEEIRTLLPNEWGVPYPVGLSNSLNRDQLALLARSEPGQPVGQGSTIVVITPLEDFVGTVDLPFAVDKAINIAYDDAGDHLLLLEDGQFELGRVAIGEDGMPDANTLTRFDIGHLGIRRASGMDVDIASRNLFILDSGTLQIVSADIDDEFKLVSKIDVSLAGEVELRGIAVHPASHNLFVQWIFNRLTADTSITPYITGEFGVGLALTSLVLGYIFWRMQRDKSLQTQPIQSQPIVQPEQSSAL